MSHRVFIAARTLRYPQMNADFARTCLDTSSTLFSHLWKWRSV